METIDEPSSANQPRRRLASRLLLLAGVLGVFAVAFLIVRAIGSEADPPPLPEVAWIQLEEGVDPASLGSVAAGPGGFVRSIGDTFQFSPDGRSWTDIELPPGIEDDQPGRDAARLRVLATANTWMIAGREGVAWLSDDGAVWQRSAFPEDVDAVWRRGTASGAGFYLPLSESADQYMWSTDGASWTPSEPPLDTPPTWSTLFPFGTREGITWISHDPDAPHAHLAHTTNGTDWAESELDYRGILEDRHFRLFAIERLDDQWVLIGDSFTDPVYRDDAVVHIWTSPDGIHWDLAETPAFFAGPGDFDWGQHTFGDLLVVPFVEQRPILHLVTVAWATRDGAAWYKVGEDLQVPFLAGRRNADSTYTGLYFRIE